MYVCVCVYISMCNSVYMYILNIIIYSTIKDILYIEPGADFSSENENISSCFELVPES